MADGRGIPLLSGPPPSMESGDSCRKCGKEFNMFLNRSRKCNHCGYSYCHSCTDYQALMPRGGQDAGYDSMNVCAYCVDFLTITASGRGQLKAMALGKLKKYVDAYNIKIDRAVEKDDVIDGILAARNANGCLARGNEDFYRRYSVPSRTGPNRRGLFSRPNQNSNNTPPPPPRPARVPSYNFPRPDLEPDAPPPQHHYTPPHGPPPAQQYQRPHQYNTPPHSQPQPQHPQPQPPPSPPPVPPRPDYYYHHSPPPMPGNRPDFPYGHHPPPHPPHPPHSPHSPHMPQPHPYPPTPPHVPHTSRPTSSHAYQRSSTPYSSNNVHQQSNHSQSPPRPPRAASAAPPPSAPPPSLDELLNMTSEAIGSLSISALKAILFTNHVNAGMILEKSDLVAKVKVLAADERRERERQRALEELEEEERVERQRVLLEQFRAQRDREETAHNHEHAEGDQRQENEGAGTSADAHVDAEGLSSEASTAPPPPPKSKGTAADLERTGLCVICQDEEANIAIVDCGHLSMCRGCSELIMASSRECPLCRTRIVTEARLLRIFRS